MKELKTKKFEFEKFEVAKLKTLKSVNGGVNGKGKDDDTITDILSILSGPKCANNCL